MWQAWNVVASEDRPQRKNADLKSLIITIKTRENNDSDVFIVTQYKSVIRFKVIFLIQQVEIQEYILENLFLKLKCQKLDKHRLTGKECCGKGVC